jgi:hypothetical protein
MYHSRQSARIGGKELIIHAEVYVGHDVIFVRQI